MYMVTGNFVVVLVLYIISSLIYFYILYIVCVQLSCLVLIALFYFSLSCVVNYYFEYKINDK